MLVLKPGLAIASTFIWIGFVGAISFMEAWLKFQAPGLSLTSGLAIGKLVFNALNKVEWVCCLLVLTYQLRHINWPLSNSGVLSLIAMIILLYQSIYLLPALNHRVDLYLQHQSLPASNLHLIYVGLEIAKVATLLLAGFTQLRDIHPLQIQTS